MKLIKAGTPGMSQWMHKWSVPDGHNAKPVKHMAVSRIFDNKDREDGEYALNELMEKNKKDPFFTASLK